MENQQVSKRPLIILSGPTASGKTKTSVMLAKAINGEIISADSMQVYKGMDIGTAKVMPEEMDGVRHHLIDVLDPDDGCSIAKFQSMVKAAMEDIYSRGRVPILAGGTGFYIQAILYDIDFEETIADESIREKYDLLYKQEGIEPLYKMLEVVDPDSLKTIHKNNVKRVIRALEYYDLTGEPISVHNARERDKEAAYNFAYYVLELDREVLYDRINHRVDLMVEAGLVQEVKGLLDRGYDRNLVSMQGLGYKEIVAYLQGELTLDEAVDILKRDTRRFAKRQLTWFRREKDVVWVNVTNNDYDFQKVLNIIVKDIEVKKIL